MSDATWQGFGERDRGGSLKIAAEQIGGAGHLEPGDDQSWSAARISVSSSRHPCSSYSENH